MEKRQKKTALLFQWYAGTHNSIEPKCVCGGESQENHIFTFVVSFGSTPTANTAKCLPPFLTLVFYLSLSNRWKAGSCLMEKDKKT
jgi:hypothetical protein